MINSNYNYILIFVIIYIFVQPIFIKWYIDSELNLGDSNKVANKVKFNCSGKGTLSFFIEKYTDQNAKSFEISMNNVIKLRFTFNDVSLVDLDESHGFTKKTNLLEQMNFLKFDEYRKSSIKLWISFHAYNPCFIKVGYGELFEDNVLYKFESKKTNGIRLLKQINSIQIDKLLVISDLFKDNEALISDLPIVINSLNTISIENLKENYFLLNSISLPSEIQRLHPIVSSFNLKNEDLSAITFSYYDNPNGFLNKISSNKPNSTIVIKFLQSNSYIFLIEIYPKFYISPISRNRPFGLYKVLEGEFTFKWFNSISEEKTLQKDDITWSSKQMLSTVQIKNSNEDNYSILLNVVFFPNDDLNLNENLSLTYDCEFSEMLNQIRNDYVKSKKTSNNTIYKRNTTLNSNDLKIDSIGLGILSFRIKSYNFKNNSQFFAIRLEKVNLNFSYNDVRLELDQSYGFQKKLGKKSVNYLNLDKCKNPLWISFNGFGPYFIKIGFGYFAESNILCTFETNELKGITLLQEISFVALDKVIQAENVKVENRAFLFDPPLRISNLDKNSLLEKSNSITSNDLTDKMNHLYNFINSFSLSLVEIEAINFSLDNQNCFLYEHMAKNSQESKISISLETNEILKSHEFELYLEIYPKKYASDEVSRIKNIKGIYKVVAGAFNFSWYNRMLNNSYDQIDSTIIFKDNSIRLLTESHEINKLDNIQSELASVVLKGYVGFNNMHLKTNCSLKIKDILKQVEIEYENKSCNSFGYKSCKLFDC
jgi:hypothetical protein